MREAPRLNDWKNNLRKIFFLEDLTLCLECGPPSCCNMIPVLDEHLLQCQPIPAKVGAYVYYKQFQGKHWETFLHHIPSTCLKRYPVSFPTGNRVGFILHFQRDKLSLEGNVHQCNLHEKKTLIWIGFY